MIRSPGINPPLQPTAGGAGLLALALALCVAVVILLADGPSSVVVPTGGGVPEPPPTTTAPGTLAGASTPLVTIPDADDVGVADTILIEQDAVVSAVAVEVAVAHDYPSDLTAELVSPSGTVAELYSLADPPPERLDSSDTPALAALAGEPAGGEWTLQVRDTIGDDEGVLESWSLSLTTE